MRLSSSLTKTTNVQTVNSTAVTPLHQISSSLILRKPFRTSKHLMARFRFVVKNPLYLPVSNSSAIKAQPSSRASTIITQFFSKPEPVLSTISVFGRPSNPSSQFSSSYQIHLLCKLCDRHVLILYIIEIADPLKQR